MNQNFTESDIKEISRILNSAPKHFENSWQWQIKKQDNSKPLVLSIYKDAALGDDKKGVIISVQTQHGFYELHDCSGFMLFDPDEVFFIKSEGEFVSSLIVGRQCTCSLYSGIRREILNSDFSKLEPAVLLSAMQLSITENSLP